MFAPMTATSMTHNDDLELLSCEESQPRVNHDLLDANGNGLIRRAALPLIALTLGLAAGGAAHKFSLEGRMRPPVQPYASAQEMKYSVNMSALEGKTRQVSNSAYPVPPSGWCGLGMPSRGSNYVPYIKCGDGSICCTGPHGNLCGAPGGFCANGDAGSIVCGAGATGCRNDAGAAYCCAAGNKCYQNICVAGYSPGLGECFPGEASVTVKGIGAVPIQSLRSGNQVLAKNGEYEPVLGFLHVMAAGDVNNFLTVKHSNGHLRVSPHHVVFVENGDKLAVDLVAGDKLLVADSSGVVVRREVLSVTESSGRSGMYAPITPSGTLVVDNVVASNYASYGHVSFPHSALHSVFFPVRAFHALGFASLPAADTSESSLHPYAATIWHLVGPIATKVL